MTQQDLADRTGELGHPMNRVTLAKIEGGGKPNARAVDRVRADNLTLTEMLVLAAALEVPPALLVVPLGEVEPVSIGGLDVHPHILLDWLCGDAPLFALPDNLARGIKGWHENRTPLRLYRALRERQDRAGQADMIARSAASRGDADAAARASATFDDELRRLSEIRELIEEIGLSLDPLPPPWQIRLDGLGLPQSLSEEIERS